MTGHATSHSEAVVPRSGGKLVNGLVGMVTGTLGGLIGLGGAEFRLPWLGGRLGLSGQRAVPLNMGISLATLAVAFPARSATVPVVGVLDHLPELLGLVCGSMVAAYVAVGWARHLSPRTFGRIIFTLLVGMGLMLIAESLFDLAPLGLAPDAPWLRVALAVAFGLGIGVVSSLLGVAGGELIIPVLVIVFGLGIKLAGSLSLLISLPTVIVGLSRYIANGALRDKGDVSAILVPMAIGSAVGAAIGAMALGVVSAVGLKGLLGVVLLWSAWRSFRHHA